MQYTQEQRQTIVEVLTGAKKLLAPNVGIYGSEYESHYICDCVRAYVRSVDDVKWHEHSTKMDLVCDIISERIENYISIISWLKSKHPHLRAEVEIDYNTGGVKCQEYRKAWVQSLIEEFSV